MKAEDSPFAGWLALQARLDENQCLEVVEYRGNTWRSKFEWQESASDEQIETLKGSLGIPVSETYASFLRLNNGCRLFVDVEYGQWGYVLYSSEDLVSKRAQWGHIYTNWPKNYLVFGECLGDSDLLVMDIETPSLDGSDCAVLCFPHAYFPEREGMSEAYQKWLDHLIIAQGSKFWRWR